jgi:uncharacterized protein (DUF2147 family)
MKSSLSATAMALIVTVATALPAADSSGSEPQSPVGLWRTANDRTGKLGGLLRIYEKQGNYFARIERSSPSDDVTEVCTACVDERRNKPIVGLIIMRNMKLADGEYAGGDILDPRSGSVYGCKFWLEQGGMRLVVRGFIGISLLGRSQTWTREE